jgi:hypothetical protein
MVSLTVSSGFILQLWDDHMMNHSILDEVPQNKCPINALGIHKLILRLRAVSIIIE